MNIMDITNKILKSDKKIVLTVTGGGTSCIPDMLKFGGGSAVLLEAIVPYSIEAFKSMVGYTPEKLVSEKAARSLAMSSYMRGLKLGKPTDKILGLGCSAALAKVKDERAGREHQACIAVQTRYTTISFIVKLPHLGREVEEKLISDLILKVLAGASEDIINCDWRQDYSENIIQNFEVISVSQEVSDVLHGKLEYICLNGLTTSTLKKSIKLAGSFNPLHRAHTEMADIASKHYGLPVTFEISITNVDKAPLDYIDIHKRMEQFKGNLVLTNAPLVIQKARLFPNSVFVCGIDSWDRIKDIKYYDNDPIKTALVLAEIKNLGCTFMVFPRKIDGVLKQLGDDEFTFGLAIPSPVMPTHLDCSSTKIRAEASK